MLADRIRELFENNELAIELGEAARIRAQARPAPELIVRDFMAAYQAVAEYNGPQDLNR